MHCGKQKERETMLKAKGDRNFIVLLAFDLT